MRLLIRLRALRRVTYNLAYHKDLQGLIYKFLRDSKFKTLHDKKGYKYFSFSNIIPPSRIIDEGSSKSLVIASPNKQFIETLSRGIDEVTNRELRIGEMIFKIEETRTFKQEFPQDGSKEFALASGTPIVVRIPQNRLQEYGITPNRQYRYVYWRKEHPPKAFMKQLEENLIKKYNEYHETEMKPSQIFEQLKFRKQIALPLRIKGGESTIIGTLWDFRFTAADSTKREIMKFGLDAGFGEMNSLGFGFMNLNGVNKIV